MDARQRMEQEIENISGRRRPRDVGWRNGASSRSAARDRQCGQRSEEAIGAGEGADERYSGGAADAAGDGWAPGRGLAVRPPGGHERGLDAAAVPMEVPNTISGSGAATGTANR